MTNFVLTVLYLVLGINGVAQAYLDPGTGSFVLQMLVAGILGALLYVKLAWTNVKAFFYRLFPGSPKTEVEKDAVAKTDNTSSDI